jgi:hypothetical protein
MRNPRFLFLSARHPAARYTTEHMGLPLMTSGTYRYHVNAITIISSGAFAGGNLFIGLSMGAYWLRLSPPEFVASFFPQFSNFLFTIMPLFVLVLVGLVLSVRLDWRNPTARGLWLTAIGLYVALSLITVFYHMPLNARLASAIDSPVAGLISFFEQIAVVGPVTLENGGDVRAVWLLGHIPRVLITLAIPVYALRAVLARLTERS